MSKNKVCDFCLEEGKGLFKQPEEITGGYHICKKCRKTIEDSGLPVKYDLFQLLVTAEPAMRIMIMNDYLESHKPNDTFARYFPMPKTMLHRGEHCITMTASSITVDPSLIPVSDAPSAIVDVSRSVISNIPSAETGTAVEGTLFYTDAALYFLSPHFINCHRVKNIHKDESGPHSIAVKEKDHVFTYTVAHPELLFLRASFYARVTAVSENMHSNLIYLSDENTFVLTPGFYEVPRHFPADRYIIEAEDNKGLTVHHANGSFSTYHGENTGMKMETGCRVECLGRYKLTRTQTYQQKNESNKKDAA